MGQPPAGRQAPAWKPRGTDGRAGRGGVAQAHGRGQALGGAGRATSNRLPSRRFGRSSRTPASWPARRSRPGCRSPRSRAFVLGDATEGVGGHWWEKLTAAAYMAHQLPDPVGRLASHSTPQRPHAPRRAGQTSPHQPERVLGVEDYLGAVAQQRVRSPRAGVACAAGDDADLAAEAAGEFGGEERVGGRSGSGMPRPVRLPSRRSSCRRRRARPLGRRRRGPGSRTRAPAGGRSSRATRQSSRRASGTRTPRACRTRACRTAVFAAAGPASGIH